MTKFHLISFVLLTLVSSIFAIPQQQGDNLQPRVELLETTVAKLSARVEALEALGTNNTGSSKTTSSNSDSEKTEIDYEVASIDAKITESNSVFVKYAWILTIKNNGKQRLLFNANIEFLDADGFIVDQDFAYRLLIEPYETQKYTGAKLVNTSIAGKITQITAKTNVVSFEDVENAIALPTENVTPTPIPNTGDIVTSTYKVTVDTQVNLRTGPGTNYQVAGATKKGEILTIIGVTDGWYLLDNGNWIFGQLIGEIPSSIPIVPTPTPDGETSELPTAADGKQQYSEHIVQLGDTVGSIATKYRTTKETIIELNDIGDGSLLFVGQKLRIPNKTGLRIAILMPNDDLSTEAIEVINDGDRPYSLQGWRIQKVGSFEYVLDDLSLFSGTPVKIFTGSGVDDSINRYWNLGATIWHAGAIARLIDNKGNIVVTYTIPEPIQPRSKQLEATGSTSFKNSKYEVSIDSCEYQSTSDDKTFDRYLCVEQWKNKSSKGVVLKITIHLFDSDGVELTTSGTISSYASDSGSTSTIKVLIDYPQAEQVAKYSVTVEEQ